MNGSDRDAAAKDNRRQMQAVRAFVMCDSRKAEDFYFEVYERYGGPWFMRDVLEQKKNWL